MNPDGTHCWCAKTCKGCQSKRNEYEGDEGDEGDRKGREFTPGRLVSVCVCECVCECVHTSEGGLCVEWVGASLARTEFLCSALRHCALLI